MLENGAEISRVEEVMQRISACYGVSSSNFFVLSNGIFTTGQGGYANVEFIPFHGTQLDKVVAVTQLSRDIESGKYTLDEANEELQRIRTLPPHPAWEQITASAIGSAGFCAIFGGGLVDCAISFFSGILLWCFVLFFSAPNFSKVTANILGGALVTVFCILAHHLGLGHLGNIMIGAIIPLIPGVPFTNGIRDLAAEDYIAGATRLLDALMVFLCIAVGVCITFLVDSHIEGSMTARDADRSVHGKLVVPDRGSLLRDKCLCRPFRCASPLLRGLWHLGHIGMDCLYVPDSSGGCKSGRSDVLCHDCGSTLGLLLRLSAQVPGHRLPGVRHLSIGTGCRRVLDKLQHRQRPAGLRPAKWLPRLEGHPLRRFSKGSKSNSKSQETIVP